jgi:hypothetical protein
MLLLNSGFLWNLLGAIQMLCNTDFKYLGTLLYYILYCQPGEVGCLRIADILHSLPLYFDIYFCLRVSKQATSNPI